MADRELHDPFEAFGSGMNEQSWNHNQFDAMLEILPEDLNLNLNGSAFNSTSTTKSPAPLIESTQSNTNQTRTIGNSIDKGRAQWEQSITGFDESALRTKPIDIVQASLNSSAGQGMSNDSNLQNGEIAQLWDFNVDEFMMTPSEHSDSATISAPSSFNSEHFTPIIDSNNNTHVQNNWSHLVQHHHELVNPSSFQGQSIFHGSNNSTQSTIKLEEYQTRPTIQRKTSNRNPLIKTEVNEDGALPLSSHITTHLVKKNSAAKNMPSNTLPQYRRGSSTSLQNLNGPSAPGPMKQTSKPQVQCFNCKTLKTPLWRRDPEGNTLCNACGLFQKLHGTMRPLSLKSDIIKKRNTKKRVKKDDKSKQVQQANSAEKNGSSPEKTKKVTKATFSQPSTPSSQTPLNPNSLNNHNKKLSAKSRRSSTSSSNSSRSSSSRSVVPILPKPSPSSREGNVQQFQYQMQMQMSQPNSGASSPRYSNSPRLYPTSPSTGIGVAIPRRKSSRALIPQSSSFMAQSLQQLQSQQEQTKVQQSNNNLSQIQQNQSSTSQSSSNATISAPNSWVNNPVMQQPPNTSPNSPRSPFDLFSSTNAQPKKSHTSLLSQQLQNSSRSHSAPISEISSPPQNQQFPNSSLPAASPRSSYADTLQQQRGIFQYEQQAAQRRRISSTRTPVSSLTNSTPNLLNKSKKDDGVMDDLEWLKFGM